MGTFSLEVLVGTARFLDDLDLELYLPDFAMIGMVVQKRAQGREICVSGPEISQKPWL
jgi:hypothetical protein